MAKVIYTYTIPEGVRWEGGPQKLGLQLLTADQELTASRLGRFDVMKQQFEAIKAAIVELDDKSVTNVDGAIDVLWNKAGPKFRALMLRAYSEISTASEVEEESFFASREMRVV